MASHGGSRRYSSSRVSTIKDPEVNAHDIRRRHTSEGRDGRHRHDAVRRDDAEAVYVYKYGDGGKRHKEEYRPPPLRRSSHTVSRARTEPPQPQHRRSQERDRLREATARRESYTKQRDPGLRSRREEQRGSSTPVARSTSLREGLSPQRSTTAARMARPVSYAAPPPPPSEKPSRAPSTRQQPKAPGSIFGSIFKPSKAPEPILEKRVECLTCLSSFPISKTARLACTHRMCHACLKRIFTLSVTDPQHMPPKCCTSEHIPLKHVDKLFDIRFKKKWNQKYQEYTTKNRVYCPARGCGEWIKPANIYLDTSGGANGGRKYGKCGRCRTKVCCTCNGRWHSRRECPKDEAAAYFAEFAKKEGWQRCFNCSATVELREGCNHMTCRCRAEFCMICGAKWKSCDCPWFNYDAVERDRLNHMQIPQPVPRPQGRNPALGYQEEMDRRREQEGADEDLARRIQALGLDDREPVRDVNDYLVHPQPPLLPPEIIRRAHDLLSGQYGPAQMHANRMFVPPFPMQERPPMRQHSTASRAYNNRAATRASERVVPGRMATDYESERVRHAPTGGAPEARPSTLAGLTRTSTEGRVDAWRRFVEV